MALPFLPAAFIPSLFGTIEATDPPEPLCQQFKWQQIIKGIFPITSWSTFEWWTTNYINYNVEEWHKKLNSGAKSQHFLNLYKLIHVLYIYIYIYIYTQKPPTSVCKYQSFPMVWCCDIVAQNSTNHRKLWLNHGPSW